MLSSGALLCSEKSEKKNNFPMSKIFINIIIYVNNLNISQQHKCAVIELNSNRITESDALLNVLIDLIEK